MWTEYFNVTPPVMEVKCNNNKFFMNIGNHQHKIFFHTWAPPDNSTT